MIKLLSLEKFATTHICYGKFVPNIHIRACVGGVVIGWIENLGEKSGEKMGVESVWLRGGMGKKMIGSRSFLTESIKNQFPQIKQNIRVIFLESSYLLFCHQLQ